ncbi:hypothetical protein [Arthrobacter sp. efr-133-TYG-118]|uniref:hypothetical protein n=1 Tax=Arthrobacter sp. efr-133-TYG-118 TaxID=3040279 RepID=UPI00254A952C|nr:hypothetical protein [Arthrobacter sp. efr-133-TYG-118]
MSLEEEIIEDLGRPIMESAPALEATIFETGVDLTAMQMIQHILLPMIDAQKGTIVKLARHIDELKNEQQSS